MTDLRQTTWMIMLIFGFQSAGLGVWLALIPEVKEALSLSKAQLSVCLLGMPLTLIPFLKVAGAVVDGYGPRRVLIYSFPGLPAVMALPYLAGGPVQLFAALACAGALIAFLEAGMNVYAGRLEKVHALTVMSRCHGFWALGVMGGSALTALMAGMSPLAISLIITAPTALAGAWSAQRLIRLRGDEPEGPAAPARSLRQMPAALIYVSVFVFTVTLVEGAMSDWAAVYLTERWPDGAEFAGIGVTVFAAFLAGGRFLGDWAKLRFGAVGLARVTATCALAGLALLVIPLPVGVAFAGFALVGLGVSVGYPLGVSAVASLDDTYESPNIAIMSMIALCGFLIGPPVIGFIAEAFSLPFAFAALLPLLGMSLALSRHLGQSESKPPESERESA